MYEIKAKTLQPTSHFAWHGIFSYTDYENQITHFRPDEPCVVSCTFKQVTRKVNLFWSLTAILLNTKYITIPHPSLPKNTIISWRRQETCKIQPSPLLQQTCEVIWEERGALLRTKAIVLCFAKRKPQAKDLSVQHCVSSALVLPEHGPVTW